MSPKNSNSSKRNPNHALLKFRKKLSRFKKRVWRLDVEADAVCQEFDEMVSDPEAQDLQLKYPHSTDLQPPHLTDEDHALQRKADEGVATLSLTLETNGRARLQIENRKEISLQPDVGALAAILIEDDGSSTDQLISWKSNASLIAGLKRRTGKEISKGYLKQLVLLLRRALKDQGENRYYVMTDRKQGYRFALRRGAEIVTSPSHNKVFPTMTGLVRVTGAL